MPRRSSHGHHSNEGKEKDLGPEAETQPQESETPENRRRITVYEVVAVVAILVVFVFLSSLGIESEASKLERSVEEFLGGMPISVGQQCNPTRPGMINVHLIPHTHLDAGWLETYDQYHENYVREIYDSVTASLLQSPERKFIAVETSFFSRWFNGLTPTSQKAVHALVERGQLQFISGGWTMADEATTHYTALIDEMTLGHQWINATFGPDRLPTVGWQIDPFGHSREYAAILSQMGFNGLFVGRVDYQDKERRAANSSLEMVWRASPSLGSQAEIFFGILPTMYQPPSGFCYDKHYCSDLPVIEDQRAYEQGLKFIAWAQTTRKKYATNHVAATMGSDFQWRAAENWYKNLDQLKKAVNKLAHKEKVYVHYSTPYCYLKSIYESGIQLPTKKDDFFPYADRRNSYWTGYFSSRPTLKYQIMVSNQHLQAAKQLAAFAGQNRTSSQAPSAVERDPLFPVKNAMGILQHHDATTGTARQWVVNDYQRMLSSGLESAHNSIKANAGRLGFTSAPLSSFCPQLNVSQCNISESQNKEGDDLLSLTIYNSYSHPVKEHVRVPISGQNTVYQVRGPSGGTIDSQVVPLHKAFAGLVERNTSLADAELVFEAKLPALSLSTFQIQSMKVQIEEKSKAPKTKKSRSDVVIGNSKMDLTIDGVSGLLKSIRLKDGKNRRPLPITQNFYFYSSETGGSDGPPSGAYSMNSIYDEPIPISNRANYTVIRGSRVDEVHQTFADWIHQIIRVYKDEDYIEFDWVIGPIPLESRLWTQDGGKEIITRISSNLQTGPHFFTDSNGRQTLKRLRFGREGWVLDTSEIVGSNYYPVTGWIYVRDPVRDLQLSLVPDRSVGGSSLAEGNLELLLHRRLMYDDGFGMSEALNERGVDGRGLVARGAYKLLVQGADPHKAMRRVKELSRRTVWKPVMMFRRPPIGGMDKSEINQFVGLRQTLPEQIHIMSLEQWPGDDKNRLLLRLENMFEREEDDSIVIVSLRDLFNPFQIVEISEMTLNGLEDLTSAERRRFHFKTLDVEGREPAHRIPIGPDLYVSLRPMDIRTFLVQVVYNLESDNAIGA